MTRSTTQNRRITDRWSQTSPNIKWLMLLSAIVANSENCEFRIPLSALDNIDNGNSLSVSFENDEVVLRYAERAETYVIQALQPWMSQPASPESLSPLTPAAAARRSSMMSDEQLADYERKRAAIAGGLNKVREASPWRTATTPQRQAR